MTVQAERLLDQLVTSLVGVSVNGSPAWAELQHVLPRGVLDRIAAADPNAPPPEADEEVELTVRDTWPAPMAETAYTGLAGDFVRGVAPYSEAAKEALLTHFLVYAGILVGQATHALVGHDPHPARHNVLIIGPTGMQGRKGTAEVPARVLLTRVDLAMEDRLRSGLVSGEGLVWHIRDGDGGDDPGITDKRLCTVETEFASLLAVIKRQGNTVSGMLRRAWDGRAIETLARRTSARCRQPHVAVVGHITPDELRDLADDNDLNNGLLNRFLWCAARRSQLLPAGPQVPAEVFNRLVARLHDVFEWCQTARVLTRTPEAELLWQQWYRTWLAQPRTGLVAAALGRLDAITHRLSVSYAQLAMSTEITVEHLRAARAVAEYHERTVQWLLGDRSGNARADELLPELELCGQMTRTEVNEFFGGNLRSEHIDLVRDVLMRSGRLRVTVPKRKPGSGQRGRRPETWHHVPPGGGEARS